MNKYRENYKQRGLCGSCLYPTDRPGKYYCTRCQRIIYLQRRIRNVIYFIEFYNSLLPRLKTELKGLVKERSKRK